jgi:hypothetical protein
MNEHPDPFKKTITFLPPLPEKADWATIQFSAQVTTIAALLIGPAPEGTPVRSKAYLEKLDDARLLVMEFFEQNLKDAHQAKLSARDP